MRLLILALAGLLAAGAALAAPGIEGSWLTEDRQGVITIAPCGRGLCGRIAGIADFGPTGMPVDIQGRPQCGLEIIHALKPGEPGQWDGTITNPEDGKRYGARLSLDQQGRLRLLGYLGIPLFGATQIWTPYAGTIGAGCRMAP